MRYDKGEIRHASFTAEGFLKVDAICTRTGVFNYVNPDGTLRRELRHPDDVCKQDSLKTMEMIPITLLHPQERVVTSENSQALSKGMTGETVTVDGKFIKSRLLVTCQDAIDNVLGGMQELSLGYGVELVEEAGEYNGERYDFLQTDIVYNHLAIVPSGRAGKEARIVLGRNDASQDIKVENVRLDDLKKPVKKDNKKPTGGRPMVKINIDGLEYECAPEVKKAIEKAGARNDELTAEVATLTDDKSKMQAELDSTKEKLDAAEKKNSSGEIDKAVEKRLALVAEATPHLDEETLKTVADMSDEEIKKAVILAKCPEAKLDEKDEVYIQARYDAALEMKAEKADDEGMAAQRAAANADSASSNGERVDAGKAKEKYVDELKNAWKPEEK